MSDPTPTAESPSERKPNGAAERPMVRAEYPSTGNPEIDTLALCSQLLSCLTDEEQFRAIRYLASRFARRDI